MTGQPIWRERLQGVGVITADEAIALGATGPILRSTGVAWDLRRDMPYLKYAELDFDVVVGSYGDAFDRYAIRLNEIRESMRIVHQIVDRMPSGDYRIQDKKLHHHHEPALMNQWRRSSITSKSSPKVSRCQKAKCMSVSRAPAGKLVATS